IKGGRLSVAAGGRCLAFVISDVVGDDPSVIGSGPTVADASTYADACDVVDRFGGASAYPPAITTLFTNGAAGLAEETPKPGDSRLAGVRTTIIGTRRDAMTGAIAEATARGYRALA